MTEDRGKFLDAGTDLKFLSLNFPYQSLLELTMDFFQSDALIARQSFPGPLAVLVWVCVLGWLAFVPGLDKVSMCLSWLFISGEGRVKKMS